MRANRVVEAVLAEVGAVLADRGRTPRPDAVAAAVGRAVGAQECVLGIDGERYQWGQGGGAQRRRRIGDRAFLAVRPRVRLDGVAGVLAPVVELIRIGLAVDHTRQHGHAVAAELADGRWRAAAEMDTERRRIERDLHDGTQHQLVALRMAVALAEHATGSGGDLRGHLDDLAAGLDEAEVSLVRTAAGVLPSALVGDGLAAALTAELGRHSDVHLDVPGDLPRLPAAVETAVYFVCLESVNNAHKHAAGAAIEVELHGTAQGVRFAVRDDGPGFAGPSEGSGLHHMRGRVAAVGGTVRIESSPGAGTTVEGFVPI